MTAGGEVTRSPLVSWLLLLIGVGLVATAQIVHLQSASAISQATAHDPTQIPPMVAFLADDVVAPLLRLFGNPDPAPASVAAGVRYATFAGMAIGLVLLLLGARRMQLARAADAARRRALRER